MNATNNKKTKRTTVPSKKRRAPAASLEGKRRVRFQIEAVQGADVYLAGSFNGWNPRKNKLTHKNGTYSTMITLPKGRHEYKFIIDDVWCIDPNCTEWAPNGLGALNSVVVVV